MYLLTLRWPKSGQPHTVPIAVIERDGKGYVGSPMVWWIGCAIRGQGVRLPAHVGMVRKRSKPENCPENEAAFVLQADTQGGNPFVRNYGVNAISPFEAFERTEVNHPLFVLEPT
jgi:hypothetical protein